MYGTNKFCSSWTNQLPSKYFYNKEYFIGHEIKPKLSQLNLCYPIEKGVIHDFDKMEKIWQYMFYNELRVAPEEQPLIMSEEVGNARENREKTTQIMFETFQVPLFFLEQSSKLALYGNGRFNGTVLNMGHTKSDACCIYNGNVLPKAEISHLGGRDVTEHLRNLLKESGKFFDKNDDIIQEIKEKYCYVKNAEVFPETHYELPDGNKITLGVEKYLSPEILFDKYKEYKELSLQELVSICIESKDDKLKDELYQNILLTGCGSMFQGISQRLEHELNPFYSKIVKLIGVPEKRNISQFYGASLFSSWKTFQSECMSIEEYEEYGSKIVNFFCFNNVLSNHTTRQRNEISGNATKMLISSILTDLTFYF
jgi:actin-related protein